MRKIEKDVSCRCVWMDEWVIEFMAGWVASGKMSRGKVDGDWSWTGGWMGMAGWMEKRWE